MERRDFLKRSCGLCVAIGAGAVVASLTSCASLPLYKTTIADNKVIVPLSVFEKGTLRIVRPQGYAYDIAVRKESNEKYTALLLRCTHAENPVASTGKGYECYLHGSTFDLNGTVTKGPAALPLIHLKTEVTSSELTVLLH